MKNLLTALACLVTLSSVASADFARIEVGAGAWMQTPSTHMEYKASAGLSGIDESTGSEETQGYAWLLFKHPIPVVPNLRLEYVSASSSGVSNGEFKFFPAPLPGDTKSTIEMTQFDVIPYYNILDNTSWITLDVGLDIKISETTYTATPSADLLLVEASGDYKEVDSDVTPLLYVRTRFEVPTTNIGLEADVKYTTDGTSTVSDVRIKVDYTMDFIPIIQPGIELGYRMQKMEVETDKKLLVDYDFAGVYVGVMARF